MRKIFGLVIAAFLLFSFQTVYAEDRYFEITEVAIEARIDNEGNMHITDRDTYQFHGKFNGIIVYLNASDSDGIENFQAIDVTNQPSAPLNYELLEDGSSHQYRVYAASENETRQFEITYTLKNVVQVYADTAELYWKFFDHTNPTDLGSVQIDVLFPQGLTTDQLDAFGHGVAEGRVNILDNGTVQFRTDALPAATMMEARILFPVSAVPDSVKVSEDAMYDAIIEQENNWAEEELANDSSLYGAFVLLIANITALIIAYRRFGKPHKPEWTGKYYRDIPSDVSPAVVSYLMTYQVKPRDLMATIMDLVRKKVIVMRAAIPPLKKREKQDYVFELNAASNVELQPHETMLIDWFFHEIGSDSSVSLSRIRKHTKTRSSASDFMSRWEEWRVKVAEVTKSFHYIENQRRVSRYFFLAGLIQLFGFFIFASDDWRWLCFFSFLLFFFKPKARRRSQLGQNEYTKWRGLRRFLRDYSRIGTQEPLSVYLWEQYLVYAIPLGEARKTIEAARLNLPAVSSYDSSIMATPLVLDYGTWSKTFEQTLSDVNETANPPSSDGSFSSGGGGGGGGGGGRGAF